MPASCTWKSCNSHPLDILMWDLENTVQLVNSYELPAGGWAVENSCLGPTHSPLTLSGFRENKYEHKCTHAHTRSSS